MTAFGQTAVGQNQCSQWFCVCGVCCVGCHQLCVLCVLVCVVCVVCSSNFLVGVFKIFGGCLQDFWASPLDPLPLRGRVPSPRPPSPPDHPLRWTAPPPDCPKFRSFFFPLSRRKFHSFFSLWGSSRGILVVFDEHPTTPPRNKNWPNAVWPNSVKKKLAKCDQIRMANSGLA